MALGGNDRCIFIMNTDTKRIVNKTDTLSKDAIDCVLYHPCQDNVAVSFRSLMIYLFDPWNGQITFYINMKFHCPNLRLENVSIPAKMRLSFFNTGEQLVTSSCDVVSPAYMLYMGIDKNENEELIKWGFPEDVWFHVDKVSSAHVYLRLHPGETLDDVPQTVIDDCAQLVKANSIQGNKMNNVDVVYTMWDNLKKTQGMDVGQVGFVKNREVRKVKVEKRINEVVNRLNKTKEEKFPDLRALREERDRLEREDQKHKLLEQKKVEKEELEKKEKEKELRSYNSLMQPDKMTSNKDTANDSDDFM